MTRTVRRLVIVAVAGLLFCAAAFFARCLFVYREEIHVMDVGGELVEWRVRRFG